MKSRAGGRFQNRNPASAPASTTSSSTRPGPSGTARSAARKIVATSATPAARPSMLSSRLMRVAQPGEPDRGDERVGKRHRARGREAGKQEDQEGADRQRRHQLGERRQLQPIVHDADAAHRERRQQHRPPRLGKVDDAQPHEADREGDDRGAGNGHAAHGRRRLAVPAVGTRRHHGADRRREPAHHRAQQNREDERREEGRYQRAGRRERPKPDVHQLATRSVSGASRSVMTNGRAPSTPSQSVSRPADAPGSSCCRRSSFSR